MGLLSREEEERRLRRTEVEVLLVSDTWMGAHPWGSSGVTTFEVLLVLRCSIMCVDFCLPRKGTFLYSLLCFDNFFWIFNVSHFLCRNPETSAVVKTKTVSKMD